MARSAVTGAGNREAKAEREVTWGWKSPGGPECREPLAWISMQALGPDLS
jgi:hypothetical protein